MKPKVVKAIIGIAGILLTLAGDWIIDRDKKKGKDD